MSSQPETNTKNSRNLHSRTASPPLHIPISGTNSKKSSGATYTSPHSVLIEKRKISEERIYIQRKGKLPLSASPHSVPSFLVRSPICAYLPGVEKFIHRPHSTLSSPNSEIPGSNSRIVHVLLQPPHQLSNFLSEITYLAHIWTFPTPAWIRKTPHGYSNIPLPVFNLITGLISPSQPKAGSAKSRIFELLLLLLKAWIIHWAADPGDPIHCENTTYRTETLSGSPPSWNWRNSPAYIPVFRPERIYIPGQPGLRWTFWSPGPNSKIPLPRCWKFNYRPHSTLPAKDRVSKHPHI